MLAPGAARKTAAAAATAAEAAGQALVELVAATVVLHRDRLAA